MFDAMSALASKYLLELVIALVVMVGWVFQRTKSLNRETSDLLHLWKNKAQLAVSEADNAKLRYDRMHEEFATLRDEVDTLRRENAELRRINRDQTDRIDWLLRQLDLPPMSRNAVTQGPTGEEL